MLTLTRRVGESILIGEDVEVSVIEVARGKVRIAIRAPRETKIHRAEIVARIAEENRSAVPQRPIPHDTGAGPALWFAEGIPGFRGHRSFVLAEVDGHAAVRALVSTTDPSVHLLVVDAQELSSDYPIAQAREAAMLGDEEVAVALVVTLSRAAAPTVNMLAPIVIGLESRRGAQVILDREDLPIRCALTLDEPAPSREARP